MGQDDKQPALLKAIRKSALAPDQQRSKAVRCAKRRVAHAHPRSASMDVARGKALTLESSILIVAVRPVCGLRDAPVHWLIDDGPEGMGRDLRVLP